MRKADKPSPTESPLLFEIDPEPLPETLTALGGVPLVVQAFRSLGLPASVNQHVQIKQRQRGYDEATFVESFAILHAVGGECLEDFERLREDAGLSELIGHGVPSPEAARKFLYEFHEEEKIEEAKRRRGPEEIASLPEEPAPLPGLGVMNRDLVSRLGRRCPEQKIATVDQDATIIESRKQEAWRTYEGERGYQPMLAVWAEMNVVLADEFRDGNVGAQMAPLKVAQAAFAALPETVTTFYYRGDSACHEHHLVNWLRDEKRANGPQGFIGFAISARRSEALQAAILKVPEEGWKAYGEPPPQEIRECAAVSFVPGERSEHKDTQPLRYVAIRIRSKQGGEGDSGETLIPTGEVTLRNHSAHLLLGRAAEGFVLEAGEVGFHVGARAGTGGLKEDFCRVQVGAHGGWGDVAELVQEGGDRGGALVDFQGDGGGASEGRFPLLGRSAPGAAHGVVGGGVAVYGLLEELAGGAELV